MILPSGNPTKCHVRDHIHTHTYMQEILILYLQPLFPPKSFDKTFWGMLRYVLIFFYVRNTKEFYCCTAVHLYNVQKTSSSGPSRKTDFDIFSSRLLYSLRLIFTIIILFFIFHILLIFILIKPNATVSK